MSKTIILNVITPQKHVRGMTALEVILPASDGQLGILYNHAAIAGKLDIGVVRYFDEHQSEQLFYIEGGFFHVRDNTITVITGDILSPIELTDEYAQEQMEYAKRLPASNYEELNIRRRAIKRASGLARIVKSRE